MKYLTWMPTGLWEFLTDWLQGYYKDQLCFVCVADPLTFFILTMISASLLNCESPWLPEYLSHSGYHLCHLGYQYIWVTVVTSITESPCSMVARISESPCSMITSISESPCSMVTSISESPCSMVASISESPCSMVAIISESPCSMVTSISESPCSMVAIISESPCSMVASISRLHAITAKHADVFKFTVKVSFI